MGENTNGCDPVELIFMGTGTSSCVPHVDCLTRSPEVDPCHTCLSTLTPDGKRNARVSHNHLTWRPFLTLSGLFDQRNTSALVRLRGAHSENVYV